MTWRPPDNTAEIERLTKLMSHYETVNLDQIQTINTLNQTHEANAKRILELEKNKVVLNKNIRSLEGRMKFDKIAADGLKKKFDLLQVEVRDLKYANDQLNSERAEHVARIDQLVEDLNHNRSDKLKFMHENANLKKQNSELSNRESEAGKDAVFARTDLLEKLQMLDHVLQTNVTFKRTIESQSAEMLMSSHKMYDVQQQLIHTRQHVVQLEAMSAEYNHTIDVLQHEISRLRKELMDASTGVSGQSSAVLSRSGASNRSNRIATSIIQTSYAFDGDETAYALSRRPRTEQGVSRERNRASSDCLSGTVGAGSRRLHSQSQATRSLTDGSYASSSVNESGMLPTLREVSGRAVTTYGTKRERATGRGSLNATTGTTAAPVAAGAGEYVYHDLSQHLNPAHPAQKDALIVDGGKISVEQQGVQHTVRGHILRSYEGVVESPKRQARTAEADALLHHTPSLLTSSVDSVATAAASTLLHALQTAPASLCSSTAEQEGRMLHSRSSKDVFSACRPIATPFRPKAESLRASLGPPPAGLGAINGGGGGGGGQHLKESIALMQNAYSPAASQVRRDKKGNEGMASRSQDPAANEGAGSMAAGLNTRILSPLTLATIDPAAPVSLSISEAAAEENADLHVTFGSTELRLLSGGTNTLSSVDKKGAAGRTEKGRGGKAESAGKKSIFVGSGLGLKHNAKLDAELSKLNKGSTQQILKKILGDRFD